MKLLFSVVLLSAVSCYSSDTPKKNNVITNENTHKKGCFNFKKKKKKREKVYPEQGKWFVFEPNKKYCFDINNK